MDRWRRIRFVSLKEYNVRYLFRTIKFSDVRTESSWSERKTKDGGQGYEQMPFRLKTLTTQETKDICRYIVTAHSCSWNTEEN